MLCVALVLLMLPEPIKADEVKYITGSFTDVLKQSQHYDKPFFAVFQKNKKDKNFTKFEDDVIPEFIARHYLAVKVNTRNKVGKSWKKNFSVHQLPTIIIFDKNGRVMHRFDRKVSENKLMESLVKSMQESDHSQLAKQDYTLDEAEQAPEVLFMSKKEILSNALFEVTEPLDEQEFSSGSPVSKYATDNSHPAVINETDKQRLGASNNESVIQVGRFENYSESLTLLKKLRKDYSYSIYVVPDSSNGQVIYRIMVGDFDNENDAMDFLTDLETK